MHHAQQARLDPLAHQSVYRNPEKMESRQVLLILKKPTWSFRLVVKVSLNNYTIRDLFMRVSPRHFSIVRAY